jgi:NAD(P)-dependent dehydrogenase (short-subunit alcohol dehydrogenase family)
MLLHPHHHHHPCHPHDQVMRCDLSSQASVKEFAAAFKASGKPCHVLMCNAGAAVFLCTRVFLFAPRLFPHSAHEETPDPSWSVI